LNYLDRFWKNAQISNLMKFHSVGTKFFHEDGQTWQNNVTFCNFENAPKNTQNNRIDVAQFLPH